MLHKHTGNAETTPNLMCPRVFWSVSMCPMRVQVSCTTLPIFFEVSGAFLIICSYRKLLRFLGNFSIVHKQIVYPKTLTIDKY